MTLQRCPGSTIWLDTHQHTHTHTAESHQRCIMRLKRVSGTYVPDSEPVGGKEDRKEES